MREDNADKNVMNAYNGGQVIVVNDNSTVYAVQNNCRVSANSCAKFQNNKKQDYIDNWNSRLFLHTDNDERPLTLADAFIMPHFEYRIKNTGIKLFDEDTMDEVIEKFMKYDKSANMLITGAPGIGKTSIVSWIAGKYKEKDDIIILRFRDWERDELDDGLFQAICNTLDCRKRDLENKIIILDGYDEIKVLNNGKFLVRDFLNGILDFKNMKAIITSRTDYITEYLFEFVICLQSFQIEEIKQFYSIITGNELKNDSGYSNLDVLGIPVILYMAIMSDIDITKGDTKPELYHKIFAEKGGIFDRFSYRGNGYDYGNQILRDIINAKSYLAFLQEIAFRMFDKNKLSIPIIEEEIPKLTFHGAEISILEFPIKKLFDKTVTRIEFVHKSIYDYFVSDYIARQIYNLIQLKDYKEELACFFGKTLINKELSVEILEHLKYKISVSGLYGVSDKVARTFQLMLKDGMTYYTHSYYKNVIACEMNIFSNMLEIIHLWESNTFIMRDLLSYCIRSTRNYSLNLSKIDFHSADLKGIDLRGVNLRGANLRDAN